MSPQDRELAELLKQGVPPQQSMGPIEAVKEGIQAVAPGLSLGKIFDDMLEKGEQLWTQGRAELAQALFTEGTAYVPYGPGQNPGDKEHDHDQPLHGPTAEPAKQPEPERDVGRER